jgi:acyl-[acyl-carrier-protein]-phospholipid O-acyltransferase/long-chain-fatty-acid--[acyl-carrier-protein] ligase
MIRELLSSRRFASLFWSQFCSALNDNVLKNALVIMLLYGVAAEEGAPLVTLAGAVFIFPFFVLSALGGELADKFVKMTVARRLKFAEIFAACFAAAGFYMHSIPLLFVALALFGVVAALFGPVKYAILPDQLQVSELATGDPDRHDRRRSVHRRRLAYGMDLPGRGRAVDPVLGIRGPYPREPALRA